MPLYFDISDSDDSLSKNVSARFFPNSRGRTCYRIQVSNATTLALVRAKFVYKNNGGFVKPPNIYGLGKPPNFVLARQNMLASL